MSEDKSKPGAKGGYHMPSTTTELLATLIGLALVYGMITLVGNVKSTDHGAGSSAQVVAKGGGELASKKSAQALAGALKGHVKGDMAAFALYKSPQALPDFSYVDEGGKSYSLKDLKGKIVLLNLWATWCGPCRREMPALDRLKDKLKGRPFELLTISVDRGGLKKPRRFFDKIGVKHLTLYGDLTARLAPKLRAFGLPATLLIDRQGREVGRLRGAAEWASRDALALIEAAISNGS